MKKMIVLGMLMSALAVSACNTVSGVGRDVAAVGSAVSGAADDVRR